MYPPMAVLLLLLTVSTGIVRELGLQKRRGVVCVCGGGGIMLEGIIHAT